MSSVITAPAGRNWSTPTVLATKTYGTLTGSYNPELKMALLSWLGTGSTVTDAEFTVTLPEAYRSTQKIGTGMRYAGEELYIDGTNLYVRLSTASTWTGGQLVYTTA